MEITLFQKEQDITRVLSTEQLEFLKDFKFGITIDYCISCGTFLHSFICIDNEIIRNDEEPYFEGLPEAVDMLIRIAKNREFLKSIKK